MIVEAKEKNNAFSESQLERHLKAFKSDVCEKIFIALSPKFSINDRKTFDKITKEKGINVISLTYIDLYVSIKSICDEKRDAELLELLEEYRDYCNEENLIDDTDNTIMVRAVGNTIDFNVKEENQVYYDKLEQRYEGFRYLALYADKQIKYVGKIYKVVKAIKDEKENIIFEGLVPHDCSITIEDKTRITNAIKYQEEHGDNTSIPHAYYLIEKFELVQNFKKTSKYPLFGKKKFYLSQFGLGLNATAKQIAGRMKDTTWEEIEHY